jgi:hypothetical protein
MIFQPTTAASVQISPFGIQTNNYAVGANPANAAF